MAFRLMLTHLDLPPCQCHAGHRGTFTMSISVITAKSVQSSVTPDNTAAMINIKGIMPTNCLPSITYHASTLAGLQATWKHSAKIRAPPPCPSTITRNCQQENSSQLFTSFYHILHSACGKPKRDDFCKTLFRS